MILGQSFIISIVDKTNERCPQRSIHTNAFAFLLGKHKTSFLREILLNRLKKKIRSLAIVELMRAIDLVIKEVDAYGI